MARKDPRSKRSAPAPTRRASNRADPVSRLARFCEFAALGLLAAALFLDYPDSLNRPGAKYVSLDYFKELPLKAAVTLQHTRTVWVTLAVISVITATLWYASRHRQPRSRMVAFSPLAVLLVIALHATALGYLRSRGPLVIETSSSRDEALSYLPVSPPLESGTGPAISAPATRPADSRPAMTVNGTTLPQAAPTKPDDRGLVLSSVFRMTRPEGSAAQWQLLATGDALFSAPVIIAWTLSLLIGRLHRKGVDVSGNSRLS